MGILPNESSCFILLRIMYEYYKARSAISLFQMYELFSQRFRGFKLEYSIHATYAIQFVLPIFLTSTSQSFQRLRKLLPMRSGIMSEQTYLPPTNYSLT